SDSTHASRLWQCRRREALLFQLALPDTAIYSRSAADYQPKNSKTDRGRFGRGRRERAYAHIGVNLTIAYPKLSIRIYRSRSVRRGREGIQHHGVQIVAKV